MERGEIPEDLKTNWGFDEHALATEANRWKRSDDTPKTDGPGNTPWKKVAAQRVRGGFANRLRYGDHRLPLLDLQLPSFNAKAVDSLHIIENTHPDITCAVFSLLQESHEH